jgi:phage host-nuclease inhibitor protein Gam
MTDLTEQKEKLRAKVDAARDACEGLHSPEKLLTLVKSSYPESFDVRLRLKSEISKRVKRIEIDFKEGLATITLINGVMDFILFKR